MTRKIGIVTGLKSEAHAARAAAARLGRASALVEIVCEGPGSAAAGAAASKLFETGAGILMSVGIAGGLSEALAPGAIVLPRRVLSADAKPLESDHASTDAIAFALASAMRISRADLLGLDRAVMNPVDKAALAAASGAVAVDMESHEVARVADNAGIPFVVLRAIADPAARALPAIALKGMSPDGGMRPLAVMAALAQEPQALGPLVLLARDTSQAMHSLSRALRLALPILLLGG
jgi:adenosylhomocysteine nucleosidase